VQLQSCVGGWLAWAGAPRGWIGGQPRRGFSGATALLRTADDFDYHRHAVILI
jgi:hypothetical protein